MASSRGVKSQRSAVPRPIRPESRAGGVNASTAVTTLKNTMQETRAKQNPDKLACAVGGDATQYRSSSLCSLTPHADHSSLPYPLRARPIWFHAKAQTSPKARLPDLSPFKRFQILNNIIDLPCIKPERGLARVTCYEAFGERLGKMFDRIALMHRAAAVHLASE